MKRTLGAPIVLGLVLTISLAMAAAGGGTTKWSSAISPPGKEAAGPVPAAPAPTSPTKRAARATSRTTAPARTASKHPRATTVAKPKATPSPPTTPANTSASAAADASVNEAGALSGTGSATLPVAVRAGWLPYYDPSGVALQHPAAWTVQPGELGPLVVSIDGAGLDTAGFRRNVNVLEQPLTTGVTAADYRRISLKQIAGAGGVVDDDRAAVLGRLAGRQVIWHVSRAGTRTAYLSIWAIKGRVAYLVTYSSDQHNFATPLLDVRRLIASITLP
jgi:hypothetical protein